MFAKSTGDFLKSFVSCLHFPLCFVAHNGNRYDFTLLQAELLKTGSDLGSNIFCVDSYLGIKNIFEKNTESSLARDAQHSGIKYLEERKLLQREMQAAKVLLEAGKFDDDMEIGLNETDLTRDSLGNENSEILLKSNMLIDKKKIELTPLKNSNPLSRMTKIVQREPMQSTEFSKS